MTVLILMLLAAGDAVVISKIFRPRRVSCCYRRGLNLLGLLNPQQVGVRAAGGSSVSLSSNLCTSAYRTVNLISAVTLKQSVSGFNNQHTALSFSHFPCLL